MASILCDVEKRKEKKVAQNVPDNIWYILNCGVFFWTSSLLFYTILPIPTSIMWNITLIALEYVFVLTLLGEKWLSSRIWAKANYPSGGIDHFLRR